MSYSKRIITAFLFSVFALASITVQAQDKKSENPYKGLPFKERLFYGGDLGLSFGNITFVRVAPIVGYNVSEKFGFGLGPSYQYWRIRDQFSNSSLETSIYGLNTFARFFPLDQVYLQTDFELLNLRSQFRDSGNFFEPVDTRVTVPIWLVGVGYAQRSGRGGFLLGVFYDLIQDRNSPYGTDFIIRGGVFF